MTGQLYDPAPLHQVRVPMLFVEWEGGWVSEPVRPLAPVGNRTTFLGLTLFGIVTRRTVRVILYSCETCVLCEEYAYAFHIHVKSDTFEAKECNEVLSDDQPYQYGMN